MVRVRGNTGRISLLLTKICCMRRMNLGSRNSLQRPALRVRVYQIAPDERVVSGHESMGFESLAIASNYQKHLSTECDTSQYCVLRTTNMKKSCLRWGVIVLVSMPS